MFSSVFISEFLTKFSWLGGWVFLFLAFFESIPLIGLVIPGATIISIGGFLTSQGYLNVWYVAFFAVSGAVTGDLLNYYLGRYNSDLIKDKKIISQTTFNKGEKFFYKYGGQSLLLGRFLGPLKQVIPLISGISKTKFRSFIMWDSLGILSWALGYTFFGYFSGTLIGSLLKRWAGNLILLLIAALIIYLIFWLIRNIYFRTNDLGFISRFHQSRWFNWLSTKYPDSSNFLEENENIVKKSVGGLVIFILLITLYFLFY